MLFLVATPIGNLKDFTFRAIETLQACDYILCEDTRTSLTLLNHYNIKKPLKSYHKFNEKKACDPIIEDLKKGMQIALISDAGTVGISDPGALLIKEAIAEGLQVVSIPGPSALITALSCSGLSTERFQFVGFLPKKESSLKKLLREILLYPGTSICYESPHRLNETLLTLENLAPHLSLVVARELTKFFETIQRGSPSKLLSYFNENPPKGEIVLLLGENQERLEDWSTLSPKEHVTYLEETFQMSTKEAIATVATLRGTPKKNIYNEVHREK